MPKSWAMVDSNFPTFTGGEKPAEQIRALVDYMFVLVEELKYQLENLDSSNWNSTALQTFQTDTTADVSEQVAAIAANLSLVTSEVAAISNRLNAVESLSGRMNRVETDVAYMDEAVEQLQQVTDELTEQVTALQEFVDEMQEILTSDPDTGAITLGKENTDLNLIGNVYVNGTRME